MRILGHTKQRETGTINGKKTQSNTSLGGRSCGSGTSVRWSFSSMVQRGRLRQTPTDRRTLRQKRSKAGKSGQDKSQDKRQDGREMEVQLCVECCAL